jgi:cyclase
MFRPRVIPVLLLQNQGLVKSRRFKKHRYIGDPINSVKIFNDLNADELVFLDITASREHRSISLDFVRDVGEEASMPFAVGGGITTIKEIKNILNAGAEKIILTTASFLNPHLVSEAAALFGSSSIVVCIDVKKNMFGKEQTWILGGSKSTGVSAVQFAEQMQEEGAGELIIQSIDRDGTMTGYDIPLLIKISQAVTIPVVALGGAGKLEDMKEVYSKSYVSALAAGSMFIYHGSRNAVLINYPTSIQIKDLFTK